jgi:hypothetical protein
MAQCSNNSNTSAYIYKTDLFCAIYVPLLGTGLLSRIRTGSSPHALCGLGTSHTRFLAQCIELILVSDGDKLLIVTVTLTYRIHHMPTTQLPTQYLCFSTRNHNTSLADSAVSFNTDCGIWQIFMFAFNIIVQFICGLRCGSN